MPLGSALHLPVPAGATSGGVPPGSALHLPVPAGATSGGVPPGSALHFPVTLVQPVVEYPLVQLYTFQVQGLPQIYWSIYLYMHQWTVLVMVSITSGNVEISWGGEAQQAAHAEQQWLVKAFP